MSVNQITSDDLKGVGVIGLDDAPGLSKADMQAKFEETARSVIIPRLNTVIENHNTLAKEVEDLALDAGQVTQEQMNYWNQKLDPTPQSYRTLTKCCRIGGALGWFRFGTINLPASASYTAMLAVQSGDKCGIVSAHIARSADGSLNSGSKLDWAECADFDPGNIAASINSGNVILYFKTASASERIRISVISENNADGYSHLISTADNFSAELIEPTFNLTGMIKRHRTLLWQNPSFPGNFPAQKINIDLSEFDAVAIVVVGSAKSGDARIDAEFIVEKGRTGILNFASTGSSTGFYIMLFSRNATVSDTGVEISGCSYGRTGGYDTSRTDLCVPFKIYGMRWDR